jgi:hypothetical protein
MNCAGTAGANHGCGDGLCGGCGPGVAGCSDMRNGSNAWGCWRLGGTGAALDKWPRSGSSSISQNQFSGSIPRDAVVPHLRAGSRKVRQIPLMVSRPNSDARPPLELAGRLDGVRVTPILAVRSMISANGY